MKLRSIATSVCLALILPLSGCANRPIAPERTPLLLVSIDGLRPTDITPQAMPHLSRLAGSGVRAREGMRPSYPSLTFPNHYTLVTGLRPDLDAAGLGDVDVLVTLVAGGTKELPGKP